MTLLFSSTLTGLLILAIVAGIVVSLVNRRTRRHQAQQILDALKENTATVEEMRKSALAHGYIRPTPKLVELPQPRREKKHLRLLVVPFLAAGAWIASTVRRRPESVAAVAAVAAIAGVSPLLTHTDAVSAATPPPATAAPHPTDTPITSHAPTRTTTPSPSAPTPARQSAPVAPTATSVLIPAHSLVAAATVPHSPPERTEPVAKPPAHTTKPSPPHTTKPTPKRGSCLVNVNGAWILELSLLCG